MYARELPVVEVQQTFYRPPRPATAARWRSQVPEAFEFTLKAWQLITHPPTSPTYRRLGRIIPEAHRDRYGGFAPTEEVAEAWARTREIAQLLRARLVLFQCPASFTPTPQHVRRLQRFFERAERGGLRFAWEPRGPWPPDLVRGLCRDLDLIHTVDPLATRALYGRPRYYRLHGIGGYRYRYTDADLRALAARCAGETYVLFNNIAMWEDARRFVALLSTRRAPGAPPSPRPPR
ncbi:MAG: DUF72 domain-containing protein [Armatimonadota bacterium]|nr:DUF72 domain-containing protein [Armatimonadota bacterium]MDR7559558.1 DUF72 domain-containing protein [Armatimonadota bacterium]MDR7574252.1 DUF72 domain-containing protein [Armatimonadota bacterium]